MMWTVLYSNPPYNFSPQINSRNERLVVAYRVMYGGCGLGRWPMAGEGNDRHTNAMYQTFIGYSPWDCGLPTWV